MNKSNKYDIIIGLSMFFVYLASFIGLTILMVHIDSTIYNNTLRVILLVIVSLTNIGNIIIGTLMLIVALKPIFTKEGLVISITGEDDYDVSIETSSISD